MREIIEQYGKIILVTVIMIIILLLIPGMVEQIDKLGTQNAKKQRESTLNEYRFYINGKQYTIEDGMTWEDWVSSPYNTNGFKIVTYCDEKYLVTSDSDSAFSNQPDPKVGG